MHKFIQNKSKGYLGALLFLLLLSFSIYENVLKSAQVLKEYTKPWNYQIVYDWINANIAEGAKIAAHSSVKFPGYKYERLPFDLTSNFTLQEHIQEGADYAIVSLDWATIDFYGWMRRDASAPLKFWKPVDILSEHFAALTMFELEDYVIYAETNSWLAPDSNYAVVAVPEFKIDSKSLVKTWSFEKGTEGWRKQGTLWYSGDNLDWQDQKLTISGHSGSNISRWQSKPFGIFGDGFSADYTIKTNGPRDGHDGYLAIKYYRNIKDAEEEKNIVGVRVSSRNEVGEYNNKTFSGTTPAGAKYAVLEFRVYKMHIFESFFEDVVYYNSDIKVDLKGRNTIPFEFDQNNIFPNSHGNL